MNFSIHTFLKELSKRLNAKVICDQNFSRLDFKNNKLRGSIIGMQLDKGVTFSIHDIELIEPISFRSLITHEYFKISFFLEGDYSVNGETDSDEINKGICRGLFFKKENLNKIIPNKKRIHSIDLAFSLPVIRKFLSRLNCSSATREKIIFYLQQEENTIFKTKIPASIYKILQDIASLIEREHAPGLSQRLSLMSMALSLLSETVHMSEELLNNSSRTFLLSESDIAKLVEAKEYLDQHIDDTTTLRELSRIVGLNEFKLKKGFKECFNTTIHNYLVERRLCASCILLKNNKCPVSEVAFEVGYQCPSKFINSFKKRYGVTPGKYRKRVLELISTDNPALSC